MYNYLYVNKSPEAPISGFININNTSFTTGIVFMKLCEPIGTVIYLMKELAES